MTRAGQKANNVELSIAPTPGGPGRGCGQFDGIETNREAIANPKAAIRETCRFSTALVQRTFKRRLGETFERGHSTPKAVVGSALESRIAGARKAVTERGLEKEGGDAG
jgi:hypothetical protein